MVHVLASSLAKWVIVREDVLQFPSFKDHIPLMLTSDPQTVTIHPQIDRYVIQRSGRRENGRAIHTAPKTPARHVVYKEPGGG